MLGVRLDKETEEKLERLARETNRSKSYYVKEAIAEYLTEKEDTLLALARIERGEKPLNTEEMWRTLGWDVPPAAGATKPKAAKKRVDASRAKKSP